MVSRNTTIAIVAALLLVIAIAFLAAGSLQAGNSGKQQPQPGSLSDVFEGNVTTRNIPTGSFSGTGVYDHNCLPIGNGMFSCDAGIKTQDYGTIDFAYTHNMVEKPCIGPGDAVTVSVLSKDGTATVTRLSRSSNYA
ncbi:MAG: hypothetical protein KGI00_03205 [Candidatus Micrarchaeota archaeon]|nr:hypothetical protein [Candidatus Micrarchaeota archaeon]MDE1824626.1 hypothetical protein [Candidatus Micrarchaeota archaeon]MDE1849713.1 hypothetical protein [Candidatus Micrarchaeota archaeon]